MPKRDAFEMQFGSRLVEITSANRILFPREGITKAELIDYYADHADFILPYIAKRPLTLHRFPEGIGHEGFYQKNAGSYFPSWIKTIELPKEEGGSVHYVVCDTVATLAYIANQSCITFHPWLSRIDKLHMPDRIIFDLDPSGSDFNQVRQAALWLREFLEDELGLTTFVMTTGSRGLHVYVPIKRYFAFEIVHQFAFDVARIVQARNPKMLTLEIRKANRGGKIFIDYLRNSYGQTGVSPYGIRAKDGAPIATPLHWDEVEEKTLSPQKYTIKNIDVRLSRLGDVWHDMSQSSSSLIQARKILAQLFD